MASMVYVLEMEDGNPGFVVEAQTAMSRADGVLTQHEGLFAIAASDNEHFAVYLTNKTHAVSTYLTAKQVKVLATALGAMVGRAEVVAAAFRETRGSA